MAARKKAKAKRKAPARKKAAVKERAKSRPKKGGQIAKPTLSPGFVAGQFRPGQSGNPTGRPKDKTFDESVRAILGQGNASGQTRMDQVALLFLDECISKRNNKMLKELFARIWPVTTKHEHSNDPEAPLTDARPGLDYSKLSIPELKALNSILSKAAGDRA
ncbi:MAG: DUF5681 domain-containing protein [Planctomycetota bacterium]|nr:DUF5681 domain-containing protein [Planctomycetota bacterium]